MSRPRIVLIVDHPLRDVGGCCLVAWELARLGADVYLVPFNWQMREVLALAPDFVMLNYLRPSNDAFVEALRKAEIGYGVLDTEGGFYGDLTKYGQVLSRNSENYRALRCMCVWGGKMYDYLRQHPELKPEQMTITGLPRFDFYAPAWRSVPLEFLPNEWRDNKQLVLINTKVSVANPQFQSREKEIETYVKVLGIPREEVDRHITMGERAIKETCELAQRLGGQYPESHIMIRPHPHERLQTYEEGLHSAAGNVTVLRHGAVTPWILRARTLIHRHCTTAIEAALADVPVISPQWLSTSANVPDAEAVSHQCRSMDELNELLTAAARGELRPVPTIRHALDRIIDDWLYRMDGQSYQRVAAAIMEAVPPRRPSMRAHCRRLFYRLYGQRRTAAGRAYHWLNLASSVVGSRLLWSVEKRRQRFWINAGKSFFPEEVQRYLDAISTAAAQRGSAPRMLASVPVDEYLDAYPGMSVKVVRAP